MISFLYYKISGTSSLGDYFIENMEAQTETSSAFHQIKYLDTPTFYSSHKKLTLCDAQDLRICSFQGASLH